MATSNHERVGKALELLNQGLTPFVQREMEAHHGPEWIDRAKDSLPDKALKAKTKRTKGGEDVIHWDTQALLTVMWDQWNVVFRRTLGHAERSMVSELRDTRNRWAHQERFSSDDTYRTLDTVQRLLQAVSAAEEADEVEKDKRALLRTQFQEEARTERRRAAVVATEGTPAAGFRPWREVVTPHPDVASGRYQQAEFAADLGQVHRGEGTSEYSDPKEFYRRTYLTEGLKHLLVNSLRRLAGRGGDPVVELQTNFGGGKTHSMLALYHLVSGVPVNELADLEPVLTEAGVARAPEAKRAVLVGTALSPAKTRKKPHGPTVKTLWGELAWQLLGKRGYAMVAEADEAGVSPGSDALRELFDAAGPSLVLIDEWVAFVRQLYDVSGLPAGSFDSNLTFAQALTEAARAVDHTLVVATLPASDIEIGGEGGKEALARLANTFKRVESAWRPASQEESFEIVRRRLFQPLDPDGHRARDAVARAFVEMARQQPAEFPSECREGDYERQLIAAYPIHPELFKRLYEDWSSLERFQRTRGVLRLMSAVIHSLWKRQDANLLIMPGTVPIEDPRVQFELTHYLEDSWTPIIERDVDGPHSLPLRLDGENPNLGRYSACRRVARTIYLGSAPTVRTAHRGLEEQRIKLGCTQPGESVATFGDALRRLTDQATHLYVDGRRYWYSTQPSVTRLAQDRADQYRPDEVEQEIRKRLMAEQRYRGEFARVHPCPDSSGDVPDEREARLVILDPEHAHRGKVEDSPARELAKDMLEHRGNSPRLYRNTLVFLAADAERLKDLEQAVRQYLAWDAIAREKEELNLDAFQRSQVDTKRGQADDAVKQRIPEAYVWGLISIQSDLQSGIDWQEVRLQGQGRLAERLSKKLVNDELLVTRFAGSRLRLELDRVPLWRGEHVAVKQLLDDFAQYLYLPRLRGSELLIGAIEDGVALTTWDPETFAYADGFDKATGTYRALRAGQRVKATSEGGSVVVKPDVAARELAKAVPTPRGGGLVSPLPGRPPGSVAPPAEKKITRFHGAVPLKPTQMGSDAGKVAEHVVAHLQGLMGADVRVALEISAHVPDGISEHVVRTVLENCRTLKFESHGFEQE
jgi:predicted AAA+ superfamily ATPase